MTVNWKEFESEAPELAYAGKKMLQGADGVSIGFLSTTSNLSPNIAPVCPVFSGEGLYLISSKETPKTTDLMSNPNYALHAFLGRNDEEFRVSGKAYLIESESKRNRVHRDIPFSSFNTDDPVFELTIERALSVTWENVGKEDTKAVRIKWSKST